MEAQFVGAARFIATQPGVTVTFINCCPYDVSRKKLATLSALLTITCCASDAVYAGAGVLLKFAMMTRTLLAVAALVEALEVCAGWARMVIRSGVIDSPSASTRPWTRTFMPGSSDAGRDPSRNRFGLPEAG